MRDRGLLAGIVSRIFSALGRRRAARAGLAGCVLAIGLGCAYNEELGRSQLLFVSSSEMANLASGAWSQLKQQEPTTNDPRYVNRVRRVAPKIIRAAGENPAEWEVQVFDSDQLNAFALPGNKIGIYTGILDMMENDAQIATVIGHEVAHVKFNHSGERYSQSALAQTGLSVAQVATQGTQYGGMVAGVFGLGAQYGVILPFSRKHELEADRFGVRYMARAGYDPNEAIRFWRKMAAQKDGAPPEFLSTHPADATRIEQLRREIRMLGAGGHPRAEPRLGPRHRRRRRQLLANDRQVRVRCLNVFINRKQLAGLTEPTCRHAPGQIALHIMTKQQLRQRHRRREFPHATRPMKNQRVWQPVCLKHPLQLLHRTILPTNRIHSPHRNITQTFSARRAASASPRPVGFSPQEPTSIPTTSPFDKHPMVNSTSNNSPRRMDTMITPKPSLAPLQLKTVIVNICTFCRIYICSHLPRSPQSTTHSRLRLSAALSVLTTLCLLACSDTSTESPDTTNDETQQPKQLVSESRTYNIAEGRSPLLQDDETFDKLIAPKPAPGSEQYDPIIAEPGQIIPWQQAHRYVNQTITVEGTVVNTNKRKTICFLNFDKDWQGKFYMVVFAANYEKFPPSPDVYFLDKKVQVTGKVELHRGRPQLKIREASQVKVIE